MHLGLCTVFSGTIHSVTFGVHLCQQAIYLMYVICRNPIYTITDVYILHISIQPASSYWLERYSSSKMSTEIPSPPTKAIHPSRLAHSTCTLSSLPGSRKTTPKYYPACARWSHWAPGRRAAQRISADSCCGWGRVPIRYSR